ncbi:ABC transporter ATP-binding protein [Paenibacillus polymyxa]|uniref:ATP-binding cassette domain-containing protein n=1 Tax=Paenibacillus polymyxa TaxID=1406 RepID=UPI001BE9BD6D|nr:ABC transporter ATP-binding protein [Paenibacillus polymyxa]MBT2285398.1 ABC transporter ATP-binding protein [Paenibacillus polymyxa]
MISLNNISFNYPKTKFNVINGVDITFEKNLVNVLIGLNGAGKTTLFDLLIGQYKPSEGQIVNLPKYEDILYHLQGAFISYLVTGKDYVRLIFSISGKTFIDDKEAIMSKIDLKNERELTLFSQLWSKRIGQMSVGERKWLYIVTLTQIKKKLYIFDEPTAGVDPSSRVKIYKRIEKLTEHENSTIIFSTHHLHELKDIKCKIIFLHKGEILFQGDYTQYISSFDTTNPDEIFDLFIS